MSSKVSGSALLRGSSDVRRALSGYGQFC